jgi:hypothetical protein
LIAGLRTSTIVVNADIEPASDGGDAGPIPPCRGTERIVVKLRPLHPATKDIPMTELTADLRRILTECRTIAVVGLSAKEHRASHQVARYLQQHGYRIVPVHPGLASVLGEPCYARLTDIPHAVDLVNVFRRTEDVLPVAQEAVAIGARCLWQQLGIANTEADRVARAAGLDSVMDRCIKIEHARLFGAH